MAKLKTIQLKKNWREAISFNEELETKYNHPVVDLIKSVGSVVQCCYACCYGVVMPVVMV